MLWLARRSQPCWFRFEGFGRHTSADGQAVLVGAELVNCGIWSMGMHSRDVNGSSGAW